MPAIAAGFRGPRQAMVPGHPSASGDSSGVGIALGLTPSSARRDRGVSYRAALADLSGARNPNLVAGTICAARVLSERIFTVSDLAGTGSGARRMGFPRHDGTADPAETSR